MGRLENTWNVAKIRHKSDHLITTILILEKIKKSNLAKIRKEKEKEKENTRTEKIIEELPKPKITVKCILREVF